MWNTKILGRWGDTFQLKNIGILPLGCDAGFVNYPVDGSAFSSRMYPKGSKAQAEETKLHVCRRGRWVAILI